MPNSFEGDVIIGGELTLGGELSPKKDRSDILTQGLLRPFTIPMSAWRDPASYATVLAAAPNPDDSLGLVGGTHATNAPSLQTGDFGENGAEKTYSARAEIQLPWSYEAAETVKIRFHAGMLTAIADTTCTLDIAVYKSDEDSTSTSDLCSTVAEANNMKSLVFKDIDFTITATTLSPGDLLDVLITVTARDDDTAVATGCIGSVQLLCDVR